MNIELEPVMEVRNAAIIVRDAYKRYSKDIVVLKGINMAVPRGTIYSLLGASGCGKTTLFRCIVGQETLDHGSIQLNVNKRSQIGYMPQSVSLHTQLTVFENIFFYAYLFGLSTKDAQYQAQKLIELLELPSGNRRLSELSGGQQRRVSMAVTFIHDPDIYILDEPTVGLDPIITENIWNWLLQLADRGKTIIITTHYIQEAHHAHKIGLMRNGVLLTECAPNQLMLDLQTDSIEDAFLQLSNNQEIELTQTQRPYPKIKSVKVQFKSEPKKFVDKFKSLIYKNKNLMKRDYILTSYIIFIPCFVVWISQYAIGQKPLNLPLAVLNEESSPSDCAKYDSINECFLDADSTLRISCLYLEYLRRKSYITIDYADHDTAQKAIHNKIVTALLHFPQNYTQALINKVNNGRATSDFDIDTSSMAAWIDLSNPFTGVVLKTDLPAILLNMIKDVLVKCDINPNVGSIPIKYEKPIHGSFDDNFTVYVINVMMCLTSFANPAFHGMLLSHSERTSGVYERIKATGITMFEILLSGLLVLMGIYAVQTILIFAAAYGICRIVLEGSFLSIVFLFMLHGIVGIMHGFVLGFMFDNLVIGTFAAGGTLIALAFVSGIGWPIETQHPALKSMHWLFIGVKFIESIKGINMKGYAITHHLVLSGILWEVLPIICYVFIIYIFIRLGK